MSPPAVERPVSGHTVVTGGAGYIGAMVCEELLAAGREVVVLDALEHGQSDVVERLVQRGAQVVVGD
ncbi:MAG TPA: NAD-dependent epimerase/dehydratase family protein, partial [Solirubrobacteraceae bacterium]|nr:NAD-dependent epimerase/dehydratase family protein [Solirubrobacteraceae bacterium]